MLVRSAKNVISVLCRLTRTALELRLAAVVIALFAIAAGSPLGGSRLSAQTRPGDSTPGHSEPRIRITIPSLVEVESKLKWLIELSPDPQLRKQWKKLKEDLIDAFTDGVEESQPISADVIFSSDGLSYELRIPISNLTDERAGFLSGLRGRSYMVKKLSENNYEIREKDQKPAHMLFHQNYAWIATDNRPIPTKPPSDLAPVVTLKKDIVAEITNHTEDVPLRRATFQAFRSHAEGSSRKRRNESQNAFELRKLLLKQVLNAAAPFLVEAEHFQISWILDTSAANGFGRGEVLLTALPGTPLLRMIEESGTRPGYFANVKAHDNPLAALNLSVPLDAIRAGQLKAFYKSLQSILDAEIETRSSKTGRDALTRAMSVFINLMEEGTELSSIDAFAELFSSATNKNTLIWGIRAANGKKADEIVRLIPGFRTDWKVKLNAHEHAGVNIHELTIGNQDLALFQCVFAGDRMIYVGTGKNVVWVAAGAQALEQLKADIDLASQSPPELIDPVMFRYQVQVSKLVSLIGSIQKQQLARNLSLTQDQRLFRKDIDKYVNLAHEAMSGCHSLMSGELRRTGSKIEGSTELNECVLKYVGSILASTLKDLD